MKIFLFILVCTVGTSLAEITEDPPKNANNLPIAKKLDETRYQIGEVTFDKKTREIFIPATVNFREGILEFLLVHENGKIHESLFRTSVSPVHINTAFKLLRYPPSKELYRKWKEPGVITSEFYEEDDETKKQARVAIHAKFEKNGKSTTVPVHEWIRHETISSAMRPTPWVYGGSETVNGKYIPETSGDIAAIFITNSSIINYPGDDNLNDEVWTCMTSRIPPLETPVTLIISPYIDP